MPPASQKEESNYISSRERSISWGDTTDFGDDSAIQKKIDMRLNEIDRLRKERKKIEARDEAREETVKALGQRAFHLPEIKNWSEDFRQYLANNHPFFGLFCHWGISPVGFGERVIGMAISILISITVTNCAILWGLLDDTINQELFTLGFGGDEQGFEISLVLIILWTGVGFVHAIHDSLVWYCWCTKVTVGYFLWLFLWVGAGIIINTLVSEQAGNDYDPISIIIYAAIELLVSWLIWYPIAAAILFSGVLGCKKFPVLGGRPREVLLRQMDLQRKRELLPMNTMASLADYDADTIAASRTMTP
jgi:hypothetical protein